MNLWFNKLFRNTSCCTDMCKHVLNAQVSIRAACCGRWYDCPLCHDEEEEHTWKLENEVIFACKTCKKAFRKDIQQFEESDEYCPHCANHFGTYFVASSFFFFSLLHCCLFSLGLETGESMLFQKILVLQVSNISTDRHLNDFFL